MRALFEETCWKLQTDRVPGKSLVERILGMLEKGHLKAETLSEAISAEEDEHHNLQPVWTADGRFQTLKRATTVPLPTSTEEFRTRINILASAWQFCSYQQTQNLIFTNLSPQVWVEHSDYILGEEVRISQQRPQMAPRLRRSLGHWF